jgi:hypothetical protein
MTNFGDFGSISIGRLQLREAIENLSETVSLSAVRAMKITGQEAVPARDANELAAIQDDLPGLIGSLVPVVFTVKTDRNGYYLVTDAQADMMSYGGELVTCKWSLTMQRLGTDTELDLESVLSGSLARDNDYAATGERYHVPPIGHYGYHTGSTQPAVMIRQGSDGTMLVYRGVPDRISPRWGCPVQTYLAGRVRFLDAHDIERAGVAFSVRPLDPPLVPSTTLTPAEDLTPSAGQANHWTLHNTLVKITPATSSTGGALVVSSYTGGAWHDIVWDVLLGAGSLAASIGQPDTVTVLRNDCECVVVRLLRNINPGRVTVDLTLRRGMRAVEVYVSAPSSTTITIRRTSAAAGTLDGGYVTASANDADGNRYVIGSTALFDADLVNGGIAASSTLGLDAFLGVAAGGNAALDGDQAEDLWSAYLAAPSETVNGVRR